MIKLLVGGRRSGKTFQAIDEAKKSGKPFGVLAPKMGDVDDLIVRYGVDARCIEYWGKGWPTKEWALLIIDSAHLMRKTDVLNALGGLVDRGGECIVTACPPTTKRGAWLLDFITSSDVEVVKIGGMREDAQFKEIAAKIKSAIDDVDPRPLPASIRTIDGDEKT